MGTLFKFREMFQKCQLSPQRLFWCVIENNARHNVRQFTISRGTVGTLSWARWFLLQVPVVVVKELGLLHLKAGQDWVSQWLTHMDVSQCREFTGASNPSIYAVFSLKTWTSYSMMAKFRRKKVKGKCETGIGRNFQFCRAGVSNPHATARYWSVVC